MGESYDYVIVGAGSAGSVLAARLAAEPGNRVLLLEAGPSDRRREVRIPAAFPKLFKSDVDWAYVTEPEPHLGGRRLYWPRGKMLGGSSSMNAMLYVRGHRRDYDRWRRLGNEGWGYDDVLPYFKRAEDQVRGAGEYHGAGGPLAVAEPRSPNRLSRAFVAAAEELGFPRNDDFNGARQAGFGLYQVTQRRGRRCSAAVAYLQPARRRPNLTVLTGARALRVELEGGEARGVVFLHRGREERAAAGEVILAGGAVNSPQLLLLSGIGPAAQLRAVGLPVACDLPAVGRHLKDHPVTSVVYRARRKGTLDDAESLGNLLRYLLLRRGPLTSCVCEAGGFVRSRDGLETPDLQFHFVPAALIEHGFRRATRRGFNLGVTLIRPRSAGAIELASADPLAPPRIRGNYLADGADLEVLLRGVELARRLAAAPSLASLAAGEVLPGDGVQGPAALADFVRATLETLYHPVGSCRMGPSPDGERPAVVDAQLRVHGVGRLRVADASVMPEIPGGNTNAPTIMIAEKAADLILGRGAAP
ncbi:MAG: choline dehydrogenase [Acidobacteria bacterium]|nr:MAG: choline dehydrogenase [Acidobacteriota bacterium]